MQMLVLNVNLKGGSQFNNYESSWFFLLIISLIYHGLHLQSGFSCRYQYRYQYQYLDCNFCRAWDGCSICVDQCRHGVCSGSSLFSLFVMSYDHYSLLGLSFPLHYRDFPCKRLRSWLSLATCSLHSSHGLDYLMLFVVYHWVLLLPLSVK